MENKNLKIVLSVAGVLGLIWLVTAFWNPKPDLPDMFDQQVENQWLSSGQEQVDALTFFKEGGQYFNDRDEEDEEPVDRDVVVPLIKRLTEEAGMKWTVVPEAKDKTTAYTILAKMPEEKERLKIIDRIIKEEKSKFKGMILDSQGYKWLSFDFLGSDEVDEDFRKAWESE